MTSVLTASLRYWTLTRLRIVRTELEDACLTPDNRLWLAAINAEIAQREPHTE